MVLFLRFSGEIRRSSNSRTRSRRKRAQGAVLERVEHDELGLLLAAAGAFEALLILFDGGPSERLVDGQSGDRPRRIAMAAVDPERAPEADEIAGRVDLLEGHSPA